MTKLNSAQDAIKQARKGGFDPDYCKAEITMIAARENIIARMMCDPLFWQGLGKARVWKRESFEIKRTILLEHIGVSGYDWDGIFWEKEQWQFFANEWFLNRLSNGDEQKFWENLP